MRLGFYSHYFRWGPNPNLILTKHCPLLTNPGPQERFGCGAAMLTAVRRSARSTPCKFKVNPDAIDTEVLGHLGSEGFAFKPNPHLL